MNGIVLLSLKSTPVHDRLYDTSYIDKIEHCLHDGRHDNQITHLRNQTRCLPHQIWREERDHVVHDRLGNELRNQQLNHERKLIVGFCFMLFVFGQGRNDSF